MFEDVGRGLALALLDMLDCNPLFDSLHCQSNPLHVFPVMNDGGLLLMYHVTARGSRAQSTAHWRMCARLWLHMSKTMRQKGL